MCGVEGEDSFEAIPEVLAGSTTGDQAGDAEVQEIPQATCLVMILLLLFLQKPNLAFAVYLLGSVLSSPD